MGDRSGKAAGFHHGRAVPASAAGPGPAARPASAAGSAPFAASTTGYRLPERRGLVEPCPARPSAKLAAPDARITLAVSIPPDPPVVARPAEVRRVWMWRVARYVAALAALGAAAYAISGKT